MTKTIDYTLNTMSHLEDFDHRLLIVVDVDGLKDLAVFAPPELPYKLVILLVTAGGTQIHMPVR